MRSPLWLTAACLLLSSNVALAQPANHYGDAGRTVVIPSVGGSVYGSGYTLSGRAWSAGARLTAVHFFWNNFAIGGTLLGGTYKLRDTGFNEVRPMNVGGDVDMIGHLPLSARFSLRFWWWVGVRYAKARMLEYEPFTSVLNGPALERQLYLTFGLSPDLLLHLSSSVALTLGARLDGYVALRGRTAEGKGDITVGPGLSYSFGASNEDKSDKPVDPLVPRFAKRGRNLLSGSGAFGTSIAASLAYARFINDYIALGPYVFGAIYRDHPSKPASAGGGIEMLADVPLKGRWSMLFLPMVGYVFETFLPAVPAADPYDYVVKTRTHELQLTASIYPVFHLFEAVVFGVGPSITEHVRIKSSPGNYLSLGVGSFLAGSFGGYK